MAGYSEVAGVPDAPAIEGHRILATIGRGGMGIVYLAEDLALGREVALKVLPSAYPVDPKSIERFRREARALARIHHPNIVPVHAIGETATTVWFAMHFVRGEALSSVIHAAATGAPRRGPVRSGAQAGPYRAAAAGADRAAFTIRVGRQLALALDEVHAAGLVHRDVKPSNVLLDEHGDPVLVDFGVACDPNGERVSAGSLASGTLRFMPPELLHAEAADPDPRADIYALGATLYELLTLTPAFGQEEPGSLIDAILHGHFEPPGRIDDRVPRALDQVIRRAMAMDPRDRFQTGREFAQALDDASRRARFRGAGGVMIQHAWSLARRVPKTVLVAVAAIVLGVNAGVIFPAGRTAHSNAIDPEVRSAAPTRPARPALAVPEELAREGSAGGVLIEQTGDALGIDGIGRIDGIDGIGGIGGIAKHEANVLIGK